jgi:hypothetical protein
MPKLPLRRRAVGGLRVVAAVAAAIAVLLSLGGCGFIHDTAKALPGAPSGPYHEVYQRWTRSADIHKDLSLVLDAKATYRSEEFQDAFLRHHAKVYEVREAELARQLAEEQPHFGRELRFVLVANTGNRDNNDFAKSDSVWRILLENEKGARLPLTEKRHLENRTELSGFFPLDPWAEVYELVFDLTGEEGRAFHNAQGLTLVVTSVLGEARFSWSVAAPPAGRK